MIKQIILCIVFIFLVFNIKSVASYKMWYDEKIKGGYTELKEILKEPNAKTEEFRMATRFGNAGETYRNMKSFIDTAISKDTVKNVMLIPANEFFINNNVEMKFAEPAVVYYLSGLQVVLPYTAKANKANCIATLDRGNFNIIKVTSDTMRQRYIDLYKTFKFTY